jgi:hypothetical protein
MVTTTGFASVATALSPAEDFVDFLDERPTWMSGSIHRREVSIQTRSYVVAK